MGIFVVDDSTELNSLGVRDWLINLIERKKIWASEIKSAKYLLTKYSQELEDGTVLELLYIDDDHDAMVINRKDEDIYCGYLLFGYQKSFGDPLPYLIRTVYDLTSTNRKINLRTKYEDVEARVALLDQKGVLPTTKAVAAIQPKPKAADTQVKATNPIAVTPAKSKPTLSSNRRQVVKPKVAQYIQESLF
jgi:hypothetical protein